MADSAGGSEESPPFSPHFTSASPRDGSAPQKRTDGAGKGAARGSLTVADDHGSRSQAISERLASVNELSPEGLGEGGATGRRRRTGGSMTRVSSEAWLRDMQFADSTVLEAQREARVRTRIRSRMTVTVDEDWREELAKFTERADAPLLTQSDIEEVRKVCWRPLGLDMPDAREIPMTYLAAWEEGKRGCLAYKLSGDFDLRIGPNKLRYFLMDGTDPKNFLTYYTRADSVNTEKKGTIGADDLMQGFWNYEKKKVRLQKSDSTNWLSSARILEQIPSRFFNAMVVCLREIDIHERTQMIILKRLKERRAAQWSEFYLKRDAARRSTAQHDHLPRHSVGMRRSRPSVVPPTIMEPEGNNSIDDDDDTHSVKSSGRGRGRQAEWRPGKLQQSALREERGGGRSLSAGRVNGLRSSILSSSTGSGGSILVAENAGGGSLSSRTDGANSSGPL